MTRKPRRSWPTRAAMGAFASFVLVGPPEIGCSPEHELLTTASAADGAATGGAPASTGGSAGAGASVGAGGGPVGGGGQGVGGSPAVPSLLPCSGHSDCPMDELCREGVCDFCGVVLCPACRSNELRVLLLRNGCSTCECAPASECFSDADCLEEEVCYRGAQCHDACEDSSCCVGNQCSPRGCDAAPDANCAALGCDDGGSCNTSCTTPHCECDGSIWVCTEVGIAGGAGVAGAATSESGGASGAEASPANTCVSTCAPP